LLITSTLWANFYYELAYTSIVAIVIAIAVSPVALFTRKSRIKLAGLFLSSFLAVWIPMRIILARQCSANLSACYEGSQLNPAGAPGTFFKNMVNGLPLTDYSAIAKIQNGRLPFEISGVTLIVALFISLVLILNLYDIVRNNGESESGFSAILGTQARLTAILFSTGLVAAAIMSVSSLSQKTVKWGYAYRHAPSLWLGYAALILMLITLLVSRTNNIVGAVVLVTLVFVLTTGQWGRSFSAVRENSADFEPVSRLYHELYNPDLSKTGQGNVRRCLIIDQLQTKDVNIERYVNPAEKYMMTFHQIPFCNR
jgi:hypothetical protein